MIEKNIIVAAFERGWRTLLREERVTARNIDRIASALLEGILDAAEAGERNEITLMARGTSHARQQDRPPATHIAPPQPSGFH